MLMLCMMAHTSTHVTPEDVCLILYASDLLLNTHSKHSKQGFGGHHSRHHLPYHQPNQSFVWRGIKKDLPLYIQWAGISVHQQIGSTTFGRFAIWLCMPVPLLHRLLAQWVYIHREMLSVSSFSEQITGVTTLHSPSKLNSMDSYGPDCNYYSKTW